MTSLARPFRLLAVVAALAVPASAYAHDGADEKSPYASDVLVTGVKHDSASVTAWVRAGDKPATFWFEYGPSTAYGRQTPPAALTAKESRPFSAQLGQLTPGTTYHVRAVVVRDKTRVEGADATFTTAASPAGAPAAPGQPATSPAAGDAPGGIPPATPEIGETVVVGLEEGRVTVRLPGAAESRPLEMDVESIPLGSVVDARFGTIVLRSVASPDGKVQTGRFTGARFEVRQRRDGLTDLYLRGGDFRACGSGDATKATAAATRPKPVRRLWGSDHHGRFRTHGRDSVATVRGTRWSITDRCDGTLTRVTQGAVDVRDRRTGRRVRVRAGHSHFARHRR